jgi:RNA polymerase sigma factor (sigma-70 family)
MTENTQNGRKKVRKGRKPCGACILIGILGGDLTIIEAYFLKMFEKKKNWLWNIRRLPAADIRRIVEDICIQVWLSLYEKFEDNTLQNIKTPKSFIWNMIRYKAIDEDKRLGRQTQFDPTQNYAKKETIETSFLQSLRESAETDFIKKEEIEHVRSIISELTEYERRLIWLRYYEELTNEEIAEITGKSPNNIAVTLHNIRKKIKRKL